MNSFLMTDFDMACKLAIARQMINELSEDSILTYRYSMYSTVELGMILKLIELH